MVPADMMCDLDKCHLFKVPGMPSNGTVDFHFPALQGQERIDLRRCFNLCRATVTGYPVRAGAPHAGPAQPVDQHRRNRAADPVGASPLAEGRAHRRGAAVPRDGRDRGGQCAAGGASGPGAPDIIRMEVGQPGTGAPRGAVEAARRALEGGSPLGYTEAFGRASLRARIAAHSLDWYGHALDPARIAVTMGASAAFPLVFLAAFDPGDTHRHGCALLPAVPQHRRRARAGAGHHRDRRGNPLPAHHRGPGTALDPLPAGLIVASPCNPAGTMLHPDELAAIARWCHARGVRLISDEIYHGLQYGQPIATAAAFSPSAVVINSFSKYFSMTGWRIGWTVLPEDLVRPVECLAQNLFISAPHIAQIAAGGGVRLPRRTAGQRAALPPLARPVAGRLAWRRVLTGCRRRRARFYLYADVGARTDDSAGFCARMLAQAGVASASGLDFDAGRGHRTLRLSYCGPEADMAEAVERLRRFC